MIAALAFAGLAAVTMAFHAALILGAPWGHLTMGGRWTGRLPASGRVACAASALVLAVMAWAVLAGPAWAVWIVVGLMTLSVVMHIATPSRPERRLWLPVVSIMALSAISVALVR